MKHYNSLERVRNLSVWSARVHDWFISRDVDIHAMPCL